MQQKNFLDSMLNKIFVLIKNNEIQVKIIKYTIKIMILQNIKFIISK